MPLTSDPDQLVAFALLVLAATRVNILVAFDWFPFGPVRNQAEHLANFAGNNPDSKKRKAAQWFDGLLSCFWCTGMWVGIAATAWWLVPQPWLSWVCFPFAIAQLVSWFTLISHRKEPVEELPSE